MQVAKVLTVVELANSEKLYKLTIDIGNNETKHVCAGLRQYVRKEVLEGSLVVVVLNLKPAKVGPGAVHGSRDATPLPSLAPPCMTVSRRPLL